MASLVTARTGSTLARWKYCLRHEDGEGMAALEGGWRLRGTWISARLCQAQNEAQDVELSCGAHPCKEGCYNAPDDQDCPKEPGRSHPAFAASFIPYPHDISAEESLQGSTFRSRMRRDTWYISSRLVRESSISHPCRPTILRQEACRNVDL